MSFCSRRRSAGPDEPASGSLRLPCPLVGSLFRRTGLVDFSPEQLRFLQFGRGVDTTRLREDFGYEPQYDTIGAFDDFVRGTGLSPIIDPDRIEAVGRTVAAFAGAGGIARA